MSKHYGTTGGMGLDVTLPTDIGLRPEKHSDSDWALLHG